jgi:glutathione S-transferase
MADTIAMTDLKIPYVSIQEARGMSGLRLILGAYAVPGPWREACKEIFRVKKVPFVSVTAAGKDGSEKELVEWTAQASAPVAIWNDERPRSTWIEQLSLAERLAPEPHLIPSDESERIAMFGIANEICGENGLGWSKRLTMMDATLGDPNAPEAAKRTWTYLGRKYGYSPEAAAKATARIIGILNMLDRRLGEQRARGSRFMVGNTLTALDIYWSTFAALFKPLPPELCPMATAFRSFYSESNADVNRAVTPALLEHRDFIYRVYLELPIVF